MKLISRISIVALVAVIVSLSLLSLPNTAVAQSNLLAFEKAIHEDVFAVASVDLTKIDLLKLNDWALEAGLFSEEEAGQLQLILRLAQGAIESLTENSVERISVLFRLSDLGAYSPLWVATLKKGGDIAEATEALNATLTTVLMEDGRLLSGFMEKNGESAIVLRIQDKLVTLPLNEIDEIKTTIDMFQLDKRALQAKDGLIFGGPSEAEIDSLFVESDAADRDLSEAIKMLNQHTAGFIVFGNQETRRVVREMLPDLPKPFDEATRDLIADHTDWGGLFLDLPSTTNLKLIFQASDNESAQTLGRLSTATIEYALRKSPPELNEALGKTIRSKLVPEVTERQVVLDAQKVLTDQAFVESVIAMLKDAVGQ